MHNIIEKILTTLLCIVLVHAQKPATSCSKGLAFSQATPSAAPGYLVRLVANGLQDPRSIKFDPNGNLLVVESGKGVTALTFTDAGGDCLSVSKKSTVVSDSSLNHGLELSSDGSLLYASNSDSVYKWKYSPKTTKTMSNSVTLVTNMTNDDHTTRTLLLSKFAPGVLVVTRGSTSNIDPLASVESSGHAQVKAFNLTSRGKTPYDFTADGVVQAWGVRNDVGVAEHPVTGGVFTVENSVDQMTRNGVDIHNTNPAEELNFLGYLNGTRSKNEGRNFGYPQCYTAWDVSTIPDFNGKVGQQFAIGTLSNTNNDTMCSEAYRQAPRLAFHPHMAPLDILFNEAGSTAWVTFHGSWDSSPPVGYKVTNIRFGSNGQPTMMSTSQNAAVDIVTNAVPITQCPNGCFRPVGLAWDTQERLFFSSDATGEIYMIVRKDGKPVGSNSSAKVSTTSANSNAGSSIHINGVNVVSIVIGIALVQAVVLIL